MNSALAWECDAMWVRLLEIYDESKLNEGHPECLFAETLIFNEGWLLRSVLKEWKTNSTSSKLPFLPFPADARVYSEGQLRTPFKARFRGDKQSESHTRVDGIAGHFSIASGTKSGIELDRGCQYIAVFEAKLYSPISKGTKNAPQYDQVSRTAACLIHALLEAGPKRNHGAHIVVLYPRDNLHINPGKHKNSHLKDQIASRLEGYKNAGESTAEIRRFEARWKEMFEQLNIHFKTWENVLDEIDDAELHRFYHLCRQFNK